jgi:hypothetical protein
MSIVKEVDDRFKRFGTVSFTGISKINDFIDHLDDGRVTGTRCTDCDRAFFPPRADCCQCRTSRMQWFDIAGRGRLVTYSRLAFAPVGFQDDVPYCIALLDYGDYKVFGRIAADLPEEDLKIGMEMVTTVNTLPNDQLNYVFKKER